MRIDHVIYGTGDLDAAEARVRSHLGLNAVNGGRHDGLGTHNRIVPAGHGSFLELVAVADPDEAKRSPIGAALQAAIANGDGWLGWAAAVDCVGPIAARLGLTLSTVGRQGQTARLAGVQEALLEPSLPFFIERGPGQEIPDTGNAGGGVSFIEISGDRDRISGWLGDNDLPLRIIDGQPRVRAVGVGVRELRMR